MIPDVVQVTLEQIEAENQVLKDFKIIGNNGYTTIILRFHSVDMLNTEYRARYSPFVLHKSHSQVQRDVHKRLVSESRGMVNSGLSDHSDMSSVHRDNEGSGHGLYEMFKDPMGKMNTANAEVQCGVSGVSLVDGECQTSTPTLNTADAETQHDAILTRNVKVGCKPEVRTCRTQTQKPAVSSISVGPRINFTDTSSQTQQSAVKPGVDVAVECLQSPQAQSRHCQTYQKLQTCHRGCLACPKTSNASTNTSGSIEDVNNQETPKKAWNSVQIITSTPRPNYNSGVTNIHSNYTDMSAIVDSVKDSGFGKMISEGTQSQTTSTGSSKTVPPYFEAHPVVQECKRSTFGQNIHDRSRNKQIHHIVRLVNSGPEWAPPTYCCILDDIVVDVYHAFGYTYTGKYYERGEEHETLLTTASDPKLAELITSKNLRFQDISDTVMEKVPTFITELKLKHQLLESN